MNLERFEILNFNILYLTLLFGNSTACKKTPSVENSSAVNIVNGHVENESSKVALSTVAVFDRNDWNETASYCSGTYIDEKHKIILTAAHCFANFLYGDSVYFGVDPIKRDSSLARKIKRKFIHPGYNAEVTYTDIVTLNKTIVPNDIALVQFEGDAPSLYKPVPLAGSESNLSNVTVSGFGITGNLLGKKKIPVKSVNASELIPEISWNVGVLRSAEMIVTKMYPDVKWFVIASKTGNAQGACPGDSGGPVYSIANKNLTVSGVTVQVDIGGVDTNKDSFYDLACKGKTFVTDVRKYREWISDSIKKISEEK